MQKNYLYAAITVVLWATLATAVKLVLKDIPSFEALAVSSAFAFVFLLILKGTSKNSLLFRGADIL